MNLSSSFFDYPDQNSADEPEEAPFLAGLSADQWAKVAEATEIRHAYAGDEVARAGETDRAIDIVIEGTLEVLAANRRDQRRIGRLATIEAGSIFGEMAFFDNRPRSATIRAVTDCDLLHMSLEAFESLAARDPVLGRAILFDLGRVLTVRLRQTNILLSS